MLMRVLTVSGRVAAGAGLLAAIPFVNVTTQQVIGAGQSAEPVYRVVSPVGERTVTTTVMAPRLETVAGKTICLVWNSAFKADVTLPVIGDALKGRYSTVRIVPYHAFPVAPLPEPPGAPQTASQALQAAYSGQGCHAVIAGNGG